MSDPESAEVKDVVGTARAVLAGVLKAYPERNLWRQAAEWHMGQGDLPFFVFVSVLLIFLLERALMPF